MALELQATVEQTSDQLQIDASTAIDQRQLGMTWSRSGSPEPLPP